MKTPLVLFTAAEEDLEETLESLQDRPVEPLHLPLERYLPVADRTRIDQQLGEWDDVAQIAYANLRNARFFLDAVRERNLIDRVKDRVNLAQDARTAAWLEEQGIPAIHPPGAARAIDLMEFLLRLRRTGATLYPCGMETGEELPGLLRELEMPVTEVVLFETEGPAKDDLERFREVVGNRDIDAVVFHSRRAVVRTLAAFPELDLADTTVIASDTAITRKLEESGVTADLQASGSWKSISKELEKL